MFYTPLNRAVKAIQSCIHIEQLEFAKKYAKLAWMDSHKHLNGDTLSKWLDILQREIDEKEKELKLPVEFR